MDRDTRKMIIQFGAMHTNSNVLRLYINRKKCGRGLISIEECVRAELRNVHYYVDNSEESLLAVVAKEKKLNKEMIEEKREYKERIEKEKVVEHNCTKNIFVDETQNVKYVIFPVTKD